jgi:hypothetical protein
MRFTRVWNHTAGDVTGGVAEAAAGRRWSARGNMRAMSMLPPVPETLRKAYDPERFRADGHRRARIGAR